MIGLTGALYAYSDGFISPETYPFNEIDVRVLVLVAFGGLGTLLGPLIGAGVFEYADQKLTTSGQLREALYGLVVVVLFLAFRRGFVPTLATLPYRLVRRQLGKTG
jgi:branched-chain amino acid transport system permease protein